MKNNTLFSESNQATYCPEDDKLRLYVGRVPRGEYEALRAEGWTSTPKQECDFVAVWTPDREDTALSYAGIIEDEDAGPEERAADRAERFAGYCDSNIERAEGHADRYDAGPQAHGSQSYARAVRAADRHDRIAGRAVNAWDKAEYWQRRTQGVIGHALYKSRPDVRMGRIKTLEAELRKAEKSWQETTEAAQARYDSLLSVVEHAAGTRDKPQAHGLADFRWELSKIREAEGVDEGQPSNPEQVRRAVVASVLCGCFRSDTERALAKEAAQGTRPAAEIAQQWLDGRTRPADWDPETGTRYTRHLKLRLAYEWQMLEAQGGRASVVEMEVGGFIGGHQIVKVNKSHATGRVVSVGVMVKTNGKNQWGNPYPEGKDPGERLVTVETERLAPGAYRAPTDEERAAYAAKVKAEKAARPKSTEPPLINPTLEDAQRLQAVFNAAAVKRWEREHGRSIENAPSYYTLPKQGAVCCITQEVYSANSKGSYAKAETRGICGGGEVESAYSNMWSRKEEERRKAMGPVICKVRVTGYDPYRVVHITDKPAKPLPAAVWQPYVAPAQSTATPAEA